jgi:mannose-6-phosphate isomerase-like protein (cupin superfamily)
VIRVPALATAAALAAILFAIPETAEARDRTIEVTDLETILKTHPLPPGGPSASVVASRHAGKGELQIVVARKIPLHIHDQDHVVFVERGIGTARIENAAGEIETRQVKPGDIVDVPRGKKHGFEKTGEEDLVLLVLTTPSRAPVKFFE